VLEEVLFRKRPRRMIPAQIARVRAAKSYRGAEAVVRPLVPHFAGFTEEEVNAFALAAAENSEVWDAGLCAAEYLPEFVKVNGSRMSREALATLQGVLPGLAIPRLSTEPDPKPGGS
jgi:hypothetical protein